MIEETTGWWWWIYHPHTPLIKTSPCAGRSRERETMNVENEGNGRVRRDRSSKQNAESTEERIQEGNTAGKSRQRGDEDVTVLHGTMARTGSEDEENEGRKGRKKNKKRTK